MYFIFLLNLLICSIAIVAAKPIHLDIDSCAEFGYCGYDGKPDRFELQHLCKQCNAPFDYEDLSISTKRSHIAPATLKTIKATRSLEEYAKDVSNLVEEGTLATDFGTEATKTTKESTEKKKAFTIFSLIQFYQKE